MTKSSETEHCEADTIKDADQCINSQYNLTQSGDYTNYSTSAIFHCSNSFTGRGRRPSSHSAQALGLKPSSLHSITHDR